LLNPGWARLGHFYSERGRRTEPEYFSNENDACNAFQARIDKGLQLTNKNNDFS